MERPPFKPDRINMTAGGSEAFIRQSRFLAVATLLSVSTAANANDIT